MNLVERFLERTGNEKIFYIESDYIPLFIIVDWFKGLDRHGVIHDSYPLLVYKIGSTFKGYWNATNYSAMSEEIFDRYLAGEMDIPSYTAEYQACSKSINSLYDSYYEERHERTETESLTLLQDVYSAFLRLADITQCFDATDQEVIARVVRNRTVPIDLPKVWHASQISDFPSFELRNDEELLRANDEGNVEKLQYIFASYTHMPSFDETRARVTELDIPKLAADVERRKKELVENIRLKKERVEPLTDQERSVVRFIDWSSWLRDDKRPIVTKCDVLFHNLISDLYTAWDMERTLVPVSLIFDVLKGKEYVRASLETLRARVPKMSLLYEGEDRYVEDGNISDMDIKKLDEIYLRQNKSEIVDVVRGEVASRGKVIGIARIITEKTQFDRFNDGEILVTGMTRPEFVPLMKKAAAIVTDEGGITSHAAIVSRELRKPCIIGTKIATKIFKDGDTIEVDAEQGIVKLITRP